MALPRPRFPGLVDQRPVTVVADDDQHLAVWIAAGRRMLYQVSADGQDLRCASPGNQSTHRPTCPSSQEAGGLGDLSEDKQALTSNNVPPIINLM